ncbi:MAG: lipopolysaccharide biosynthesis protein RfbH [Lentisphaerae bacterium]|nr:lipopolysaccharide biosynthesis protein RfbH [Lentisphaerota bacterium]
MDEIRAKQLHDEILAKTAEYYSLVHKSQQDAPFEAGKSKVNYAGRVFDEKEMVNLVDSALEFWLTSGRYSREFETKLAAYLGVEHALLVNSGSSANLLAFSALTSPLLGDRRIKRGDEVITVACGFPTTIAPIIQFGAVPVFVDVELNGANIDVSQLDKALSDKSKAVMIAHTLGNPFDLKKVKNFCDEHGLFLIEDNCDALGSKFDGRFTGTWGDIGTSSFYPPHHLTMGEGGAVYTNDPLLKKVLLSIRDWGRECWCNSGVDNSCGCRFTKQFGSLPKGYDHKYVYSHFGYNLKATDLQAAIGVAQLDKVDSFTEKRQKNYAYLYEKLHDLPQLSIFTALPGAEPSWFGFLLSVTDKAGFIRNDLTEYLEKNKIQTRNLFAGNIIKHPCFETLVEDVDYRVIGELPNTETIMNNSFWIGLYPGMTNEKLDYMADKIRDFCRKS